MKEMFSPLRIFWLSILISWLTLGCAGASQATSEKITPEIIPEQLVELLSKTYPGSHITQTPRTSEDLQQIIRTNLSSKLLDAQPVITGTQYSFVSEPDREAQVNLLSLVYPDNDAATRAVTQLSAHKGYFKKTVVLTRFSYATVGDHQLIILFTEQAGDEKLVERIDSFAKQVSFR